MNRLTATLLAATLPLVALAACHRQAADPVAPAASEAPPGIVIVSGARLVLPAVPGNPAALYLTIANPGDVPIRLTGIAVAHAASTQLHETTGGTMSPLAGLDIAPRAAAGLEPGARHAMVIGLNPAPKPGDSVAVTLKFANGGTFATTARAEPTGDPATMDAMPGMH